MWWGIVVVVCGKMCGCGKMCSKICSGSRYWPPDYLDKSPNQQDNYEKAQAPMVSELKDTLLNQGHIVLNNTHTRSKDNI